MAQAQLLYVGTAQGITILSNPGHTDRWLTAGQELRTESIIAIHCASDNPLQAKAQSATTLYVTTDGGQTWEALDHGHIETPRHTLTLPGQPPASIRIAPTGHPERSADEEATWEPVATDSAATWQVLMNPDYHQDTVYAGTSDGDVLMSSDRGRTWTPIKRSLAAVQALAVGRVIS